jgi:hypothetical protein
MRRLIVALLALVAIPASAHAFIGPGQTAPDFTKNELVGGASGPAWNFYSQPPRVTILFLLGFN